MYKITVQSYSKDKPDLLLANNIKTTRDNSGLSLEIELPDINKIIVFTGYKGEFNPYKDSVVFNNLSCTDEFKDYLKYDSNAISSIEIEYIRR